MTNDDPSTTEADRARRDAVREKAKKVKSRIRRRKYARRAAITIVIIAAVVAAGWWVWRSVAPELEREIVTPNNITDDDAIDVTSLLPEDERPDVADDPIAIDVYVDYMAPEAGTIEELLAPQMYELVDDGVVTLAYHPVSLRSGQSNGTQYSARAAGAVVCVVSGSPGAFSAFNTALLTEQPEPDTDGYTDAELADMAAEAGADGNEDVAACIEERKYAPWVSEATDRALESDLPGTDGLRLTSDAMVIVDGEQYEGALDDPAEFSQFMLTVQSEQYYGETDPDGEDDSE